MDSRDSRSFFQSAFDFILWAVSALENAPKQEAHKSVEIKNDPIYFIFYHNKRNN